MATLEKVELDELENAYQTCEALAHSHYENFPVASWFLPKKLRQAIASIYSFARRADDIADEGDLSQEIRLKELNNFWIQLDNIEKKLPMNNLYFMALADTIQTFNLPLSLFYDLLRAFKQDVVKNSYENFNEVLNYCQYSANPAGRLLLHLTKNATEENLKDSDKICTALQLINFLQDLDPDLQSRNRCYLPKDEMQQFNVSLENIRARQSSPEIQALIETQLKRAENLLNEGQKLGKRLKGLFGFEIRLIIASLKRMIQRLYARKSIYDRPKLRVWDTFYILLLFFKY